MEILSLGEKIKRRRKELNMTLKDLAGDRITPGQISLVESGKSNPSMDLLEYIASSLKTSVEYLMESEETQAEKVCLYFEDIAEFYILDQNYTSGEEYLEKALYYAEKYKLEYRKARNYYLRGIISMNKGEMSLSQQFLLSANGIFIRYNYYEDVVNSFLKLGCLTVNLKAYHSAFSYFQQAEKVYKDNDIGNDLLLGQIYYYIAYTYFKLDNIDSAINYSYLAKKKFMQIDDKKEYAKSLLLIAEEYNKKGDIDNAIKYSEKTLKAYKDVSDFEDQADIEDNLGKLFFEFDNIEESFIHFNKAKDIRTRNNDKKLVDTLICICENYIKLKDIENCKKSMDAIADNMDGGDDDVQISYFLLKYRISLLQGKLNDAENTLLIAQDFAKKVDKMKKAAEISILIGKFYLDNGNDKDAAKFLNEGVEIFKLQGILK